MVVRVERVVAHRGRRGKSVSQRKAIGRRGGTFCGHFVGLLVGEGRLMRHGGGKGGVLADGVVDAVAGAHHGLFGQPQRQAQPRRKCRAVRIDQRSWQAAVISSRASGLYFVGYSELRGVTRIRRRVGVHKGQVAVLLRVGREKLVAQAVVQGEIGPRAPVVLGIGVPHVVAQVALAGGGVDGGLLRLAQQKIRQRGAGVYAPVK